MVTPSAANQPYQILQGPVGTSPLAVSSGDDQTLTSTGGYGEVGGVGMPRGIYLGL